jgi:hypothetical protein
LCQDSLVVGAWERGAPPWCCATMGDVMMKAKRISRRTDPPWKARRKAKTNNRIYGLTPPSRILPMKCYRTWGPHSQYIYIYRIYQSTVPVTANNPSVGPARNSWLENAREWLAEFVGGRPRSTIKSQPKQLIEEGQIAMLILRNGTPSFSRAFPIPDSLTMLSRKRLLFVLSCGDAQRESISEWETQSGNRWELRHFHQISITCIFRTETIECDLRRSKQGGLFGVDNTR